MTLGCKISRPVIRRYASVSCKLMSVLSRRHGSPDILEKDVHCVCVSCSCSLCVMVSSLKFFFEKTRSRYLFSLNELSVVLHTSYARLLIVVIVVASCDVRL